MYTVFPTGTTIYKPEKCFNGYTLYPTMKPGVGAVLIDMNGKPVRTWPKFNSFMVNLLPGGTILGGQAGRISKIYDHIVDTRSLPARIAQRGCRSNRTEASFAETVLNLSRAAQDAMAGCRK